MTISKATTKFAQFSDAALLQFAHNVVNNMSGNPLFPTPVPSMGEVQTATDEYAASITDRASQNQNTAALKYQRRTELLEKLRLLSLYVGSVAQGDRLVVLSSGYTPTKERQRAGELPPPANLRTKYGSQSGSIQIICNRIRNANSYEVQYKNGTGDWGQSIVGVRSNILVDNLNPGGRYDFQIRAVGAAGPSGWSEVGGIIVV